MGECGSQCSLFNVGQTIEDTHGEIILQLKNHSTKHQLLDFLKSLDESEDSEGEINLRKILCQYSEGKFKP